MGSPWKRTAAVAEWHSHFVVLRRKDEESETATSRAVRWPTNAWIFARVQVADAGWSWVVWSGSFRRAGKATREAGARTAAMKVVRVLFTERRQQFPFTMDKRDVALGYQVEEAAP